MPTDHPDLFDVKRRRKPQRRPPAPDGAVQALIGAYVASYEQRTGEKPVVTKKDGALLKKLVLDFGQEVVRQRLGLYMAWDDPFVAGKGHPLALLHSKWQEVAALGRRSKPPALTEDCRHEPPCTTRHAHYQVAEAELDGNAALAASLRRLDAKRRQVRGY